jgi:hypothetical protein
MTSEEVAIEFARCYPTILVYAKKALWHFKSPLDVHDVMAECYCHVHDHRALITKEVPLESVAKNWVKQNLRWTNSPIKCRLLIQDHNPTTSEPWTSHQDTDLTPLLAAWRAGLDPYQRRLWGLYGERGMTRGREIALHLGISISSAYLLIKEAKALELSLKNYITNNI